MTTNNPTVVGGNVYNELALSLAVSPVFKPNFVSAAVVMSLTPIRRSAEGVIDALTEPGYQKTLVVSDAFAQNDPDFLMVLGKIQAAVQEYINAKNL
jgi:hypothetical protein